MARTETVYPEWVQGHRAKGHTVKKVGNSYYLYKRTSKRVPGKKYPQPVDTYVGIITPDGVIKAAKKKLEVASVSVREFGFSKAVWDLCPGDWKKAVGKDWEDKLIHMVWRWSPNSYLLQGRGVKTETELHFSYSSQAGSFSRKFYKSYGVDLQELEPLKYVYLVTFAKEHVVSELSPGQEALLERLPLRLEYK